MFEDGTPRFPLSFLSVLYVFYFILIYPKKIYAHEPFEWHVECIKVVKKSMASDFLSIGSAISTE